MIYNSIKNVPGYEARAAFTVNSQSVLPHPVMATSVKFNTYTVYSRNSVLSKNRANYFDYDEFFAMAKRQADNGRELFM